MKIRKYVKIKIKSVIGQISSNIGHLMKPQRLKCDLLNSSSLRVHVDYWIWEGGRPISRWSLDLDTNKNLKVKLLILALDHLLT